VNSAAIVRVPGSFFPGFGFSVGKSFKHVGKKPTNFSTQSRDLGPLVWASIWLPAGKPIHFGGITWRSHGGTRPPARRKVRRNLLKRSRDWCCANTRAQLDRARKESAANRWSERERPLSLPTTECRCLSHVRFGPEGEWPSFGLELRDGTIPAGMRLFIRPISRAGRCWPSNRGDSIRSS